MKNWPILKKIHPACPRNPQVRVWAQIQKSSLIILFGLLISFQNGMD